MFCSDSHSGFGSRGLATSHNYIGHNYISFGSRGLATSQTKPVPLPTPLECCQGRPCSDAGDRGAALADVVIADGLYVHAHVLACSLVSLAGS